MAYFEALAEETELPYQSLINLYLRVCAASGRRLALAWRPALAPRLSNEAWCGRSREGSGGFATAFYWSVRSTSTR